MRTMEFEGIVLVELPGTIRGIYAGIADLTPQLATRLLTYNTNPGQRTNRALRTRNVNTLATSMVAGNWQFNGETVKFDKYNVMRDGQHRCHAARRAADGQTFPTAIVWGLEPQSQLTVDQGAKRHAFEQLALVGHGSDKSIAAAIRIIIRWEGRTLCSGNRSDVSTPDIIAWADKHPDGMQLLNKFTSLGYKRLIGCPPAVALAAAYRLHHIDAECCAEFFDKLLEPVGLERGSALLALRRRLENVSGSREMVRDSDLLGYIVYGWNAYRQNRPMAKVMGAKGGGFTAETFPDPR